MLLLFIPRELMLPGFCWSTVRVDGRLPPIRGHASCGPGTSTWPPPPLRLNPSSGMRGRKPHLGLWGWAESLPSE